MPADSLQNKKQVSDRLQNTTKDQRGADSEPGGHHTADQSSRHDGEESEYFGGGGDLGQRESQRYIERRRHHSRHCLAHFVSEDGDQDHGPKWPMHEVAKGGNDGVKKRLPNRTRYRSCFTEGFRRDLRFGAEQKHQQ